MGTDSIWIIMLLGEVSVFGLLGSKSLRKFSTFIYTSE